MIIDHALTTNLVLIIISFATPIELPSEQFTSELAS